VTRESIAGEPVTGGFALVYPVFKAMEEAGRIRRGYFVAGLGATQFAMPGALDLLRSMRDPTADEEDERAALLLAATDPASPYGTTLRWPASTTARRLGSSAQARQGAAVAHDSADAASQALGPLPGTRTSASAGRGPTRSVGASVILVDGALVGYLARGDRQLLTWLPDAEPRRSRAARALARALIGRARSGEPPRGMLIEEIDAMPSPHHPLAPFLTETGFLTGAMGMQGRREG
jgi:ATP-dependent Lhr-like helicase